MLKNIIEKTGGIVEDGVVLKPGVIITSVSKNTLEAEELFKSLNLNMDEHPHAEFNGRLTYLIFNDKVNQGYLDRMVNQHNHLSVFNDVQITVLIAGVSIETELEFVAHNEATVSRLTSSRTNAQLEPLYVLKTDEEKEFLKKFKELKESVKKDISTKDKLESYNMLSLCSKATAFTISMSLKNWHKTFIGRLSSSGVEKEVQDVCSIICELLRKDYSIVIKTVEEYYEMNNDKKLSC